MTKELQVATAAARRAAAYLKTQFHRPHRTSYKFAGRHGIVGEADTTAEGMITATIRRNFPLDGILGEESGLRRGPSGRLWIVDALDGSDNYYRRIPVYGTSIALAENGRIVLGVVMHPITDDCLVGLRGNGATLNGKRMRVSKTQRLEEAVGNFSLSSRLPKSYRIAVMGRLIRRAKNHRLPGSCVFSLSTVATGRADFGIGMLSNYWDFAATSLLVAEAGGRVTGPRGKPWDEPFRRNALDKGTVVASNGKIHKGLLKILEPA